MKADTHTPAMACPRCHVSMKLSRIDRCPYEVWGLDNIELDGVELYSCSTCCDDWVDLHDREALHEALASEIVNKKERLTGSEVRFLRKFGDYTGKMFARLVGMTPENLSRAERGHRSVSPQFNRLVRLVVSSASKSLTMKRPLDQIEDTPAVKAEVYVLQWRDGKWRPAPPRIAPRRARSMPRFRGVG